MSESMYFLGDLCPRQGTNHELSLMEELFPISSINHRAASLVMLCSALRNLAVRSPVVLQIRGAALLESLRIPRAGTPKDFPKVT